MGFCGGSPGALPLPRGPRLEPACQNLLTVLSPPTRVLGSNGMLGGRQLPIFGGPAPDFQPTFTESQLCARPGARGLLSLSTPGIRGPVFLCHGDHPVHSRMFSSILGLCLLDATSSLHHPGVTTTRPLRGKIIPVQNCWARVGKAIKDQPDLAVPLLLTFPGTHDLWHGIRLL